MPGKKEVIIKESDYVIHSKEKALKLSITEGSFQSAGVSAGSSFMTPFALAIGGNSFHIGLLSSLFGLVGPLGQWKGSKMMERYSRKKILMQSKLFHTLLWIPLIGLTYLFWKGILIDYLPYVLIVLWAGIMQFIWGMGHVAWFSWMGDLVPAGKKGNYFSRRNRITGFVGLIVFIIAAFILDLFKTKGYVLLGFTIVFGAGVIFRFVSRYLAGKIFNPEFRVKRGYYFSFRDFVKRYDNFGKFAFFQASFYFAVMVSAPFFAVYMLEDLGFSYVMFTLVAMSSGVFYLAFSPLAGKFSDRYGNVKLLYIAGVLFPLVPVLWIFFESPLWLVVFPGLLSGLANAALIIGVTDFTYDAVHPQKRGLCVAYTSMLIGFGIFAGSLIGGALVQYLPFDFIRPVFFVFILSAVLMVMTVLFFLPQIRDERPVGRLRGFKFDILDPFGMISSDIVWFKNFLHEK